jgi:hypothetical protein
MMEKQRKVRTSVTGHVLFVMLSTPEIFWLYVNCKHPQCVQLHCVPRLFQGCIWLLLMGIIFSGGDIITTSQLHNMLHMLHAMQGTWLVTL